MWQQPTVLKDSRQKMAQMVESPGFTLPLNAHGEPATHASISRLLQGPYIMDGDLCDVLPGENAVILVSPTGEPIIMQNEGRATFHVPHGWRLIVGSRPLRQHKKIQKLVKVGESVEEIETSESVLQLENIPALYLEAESGLTFH